MSQAILFGLNPETLQAVNGLADAIRSLSGGTGGVVSSTTTSAAQVSGPSTSEPIYWRDPKTSEFGYVESEAEYKALKKANSNLMKIPQGKYETLVNEKLEGAKEDEEPEEEPQETAAQKKKRLKDEAEAAAAAKKKADADAKAKASDDGEEPPTEQDIMDAFGTYLSADLEKAERSKRATWVRPLVARFGVAKATDIAEEDRKLALNLLQRKIAGQDIDPENDEYEEFEAEDSLV